MTFADPRFAFTVRSHARVRGNDEMHDKIRRVSVKLVRGIIVSNDHANIEEDLIQCQLTKYGDRQKTLERLIAIFLSSVHRWTRIWSDASFEEKVRGLQMNLPLLGARFSDDVESLLRNIASHLMRKLKRIFYPGHDDTRYMASRLHLDPRGRESLALLADLAAQFLRRQRVAASAADEYARGMLDIVHQLPPRPLVLLMDDNDRSVAPTMPGGVGESETEPPLAPLPPPAIVAAAPALAAEDGYTTP